MQLDKEYAMEQSGAPDLMKCCNCVTIWGSVGSLVVGAVFCGIASLHDNEYLDGYVIAAIVCAAILASLLLCGLTCGFLCKRFSPETALWKMNKLIKPYRGHARYFCSLNPSLSVLRGGGVDVGNWVNPLFGTMPDRAISVPVF
mgnify:CR=1 FL=1